VAVRYDYFSAAKAGGAGQGKALNTFANIRNRCLPPLFNALLFDLAGLLSN
jgi:hypothetical protein